MKNVLIIGGNSYLGKELAAFLKDNEEYNVRSLSVRDHSWKETSFEDVDVIYHVAAIVHRNEKEVGEDEYYRVNCDLPIAIATKAKQEGVKQFIFVSTMSVYGIQSGRIDVTTKEVPTTLYGKSKLKAEKELEQLASDDFRLAIIRPPMIYGKGCKGNYTRLENLALLCPVFPKYSNQRSMLYIKNLNILVEQLIAKEKSGLFYPQDADWVNTYDMVCLIRQNKSKRIIGMRIFNWLINIMKSRISLFEKVWGDLQYSHQMSIVQDIVYQKYNLDEAISEMLQ